MNYKKVISIVSAFAMCIVLGGFKASAASGIAIKTAEELMSIDRSGDYYLARDIDLSDVNWKPISNFSGSLDGNGYEITGLTSETYGLFSTLKSGAEIKNVILTDVYITSKYKTIGGIAAAINSKESNIIIENCMVSGVVASCRTKYDLSPNSTAGAIVGVNNSTGAVLRNCYSNAVVTSERVVGGLVGTNRGKITDCGFGGQLGNSYNIYQLSSDEYGNKRDDYNYLYVSGGLCGINYGMISNSFSNCSRVDVASYYGGIAGAIQGTGKITYCVNNSIVPYDESLTGGLIVGIASKKTSISNCYSKKPNNSTVGNDVGKGSIKTKTYVVSDKNYNSLKNFKRLDGDWTIHNSVPVLKSLKSYINMTPFGEIKGENLVNISDSQSVSEDYDPDEASVDYGFDEYGNILE